MVKKSPTINGGSTADLAFLCLAFFMMTSSMDHDRGILRRLPPPLPPDAVPPEIRERNLLPVLVNRYDLLSAQGQETDLRDLRRITKEFFSNPFNDPHLSEQEEIFLPHLGTVRRSRGVVSLQNDHGTTYEMFIRVQNELSAAINELRDEMSREHFGIPFSALRAGDERRHSIQRAIPVAISQAEPRDG